MYVSACLTIIYKIREVILDLEESHQIPIIEVTEEVHVDVVDDNGAEITAV